MTSTDLGTPEWAQSQDVADALASYRDEFLIPQHDGNDIAYFCGNSLGLQPRWSVSIDPPPNARRY